MEETSATLAEIAKALCKAQGEMRNAPKDTVNPFFKSHYADLAACWDMLRPVLSKNGLCVTQITKAQPEGTILITLLLHSSGEWIRGTYPINPKDASPQSLGSAITYAKRYALQAITGLSSEDDDGNAASKSFNTPLKQTSHQSTGNTAGYDKRTSEKMAGTVSDAQLHRLHAIAKKSQWLAPDVKMYLAQIGLDSEANLNQMQYKDLCDKMEKFPKFRDVEEAH